MFALTISMPRCKSIICYQNSRKFKLFLQKNANFSSAAGFAPRPYPWPLAASPPDPHQSSVDGAQSPYPSKQSPLLQISGCVPDSSRLDTTIEPWP